MVSASKPAAIPRATAFFRAVRMVRSGGCEVGTVIGEVKSRSILPSFSLIRRWSRLLLSKSREHRFGIEITHKKRSRLRWGQADWVLAAGFALSHGTLNRGEIQIGEGCSGEDIGHFTNSWLPTGILQCSASLESS